MGCNYTAKLWVVGCFEAASSGVSGYAWRSIWLDRTWLWQLCRHFCRFTTEEGVNTDSIVVEALSPFVVALLSRLFFGSVPPRNNRTWMRRQLWYWAHVNLLLFVEPLTLVARIKLVPAFLAPVNLSLMMRVTEKALKRVLSFVFDMQGLNSLAALHGFWIKFWSFDGNRRFSLFIWELRMIGTPSQLQWPFYVGIASQFLCFCVHL